jgi:uncharacterized membrane protein
MTIVEKLIIAATLFAALGSGLIGGLFFAFSNTVMKALGRLPSADGMAAMKSINLVILNPFFLGVFMGTSVICGILLVSGILRWQVPGSGYLITGALLYLIGSLLATMVFNVPLNNALAAADPSATEVWQRYLTDWTFWNHVRTAASLGSAVLLMIGLVYLGR